MNASRANPKLSYRYARTALALALALALAVPAGSALAAGSAANAAVVNAAPLNVYANGGPSAAPADAAPVSAAPGSAAPNAVGPASDPNAIGAPTNASAPGAASDPGAAAAAAAPAGPVLFNRSMLPGDSAIDVARFESSTVTVVPGDFNVDVYLNQHWMGRETVRFAAPVPGTNAVPCMTPQLIKVLQLTEQAAKNAGRMDQPGACVQLSDLFTGATTHLDLTSLRLDFTVPQAELGMQPSGFVDPSTWSAGIPAFLLNYSFNGSHNEFAGVNQDQAFLSLHSGINLGLWQFRQDSTATWHSSVGGTPAAHHWNSIDAYVRRSIPQIKADLTLGDSFTDGAVFDSFSVLGAQLTTDDLMYPASRRGYAPVIHGVAQSNARVSVRQNGQLIFQTTVPPGPFTISDLLPTGYGGELTVIVTEANGQVHSFQVPYASVQQLVRPGVTRFGLVAGRLRNMPFGINPDVIQGTVQHGFNNTFTGYAGFQGSEGYAAGLIGGAINTKAGAFALDVTEAGITQGAGMKAHTGQSTRLTWAKLVPSTRTTLGVAAYRFSTSGFLSLRDAEIARAYAARGNDTFGAQTGNLLPFGGSLTPAQQALLGSGYNSNFAPIGLLHQKSQFTVSVSQPLGTRGGSLFANLSYRNYWNRSGSNTTYQITYQNHIRRVSFSLSASRTRDLVGRMDNMFQLTASVPLGRSRNAPTLVGSLQHDTQGNTFEQAQLIGSAGKYSQVNWGVSGSHANHGAGTTAGANIGYRGSQGIVNASYTNGPGFSQTGLGASGSLMIHSGGVTFGQPTGPTMALVHVKNGKGAHVENMPGLQLNHAGYAILPTLMPFQRDTVRISPIGLPLGIQLQSTSFNVAPYMGAMVLANFKAKGTGNALIATIQLPDGSTPPFGSQVYNSAGDQIGVIGQAGMALLDVKGTGSLHVSWNNAQGQPQECVGTYTAPAAAKHNIHQLQSTVVTCSAASTPAPSQNAQ